MTKLYWHLAVAGLLAFGSLTFAVLLAITKVFEYSNVMPLVLCSGAVGAVVNNYYRLSKLSEADKLAVAGLQSSVLTMQIYVSLLIAAILGLVLYGLCMTGLLAGQLFPQFTGTEKPYGGMLGFLSDVVPATNLDTGKVLIWSFIAGFSERMIPNVLDRLASQAEALRGPTIDPDAQAGAGAVRRPPEASAVVDAAGSDVVEQDVVVVQGANR
jgi:hypothetical protein